MPEELNPVVSQNFIHNFIDEDIAQGGQYQGMTVHTRFPPEPNGYLHIGHCKALTIDFGTAEKYGGLCNLRMDDTNPAKEDTEYVEAIQEDIHWLGFDWGDRFFSASDYFEKMYEYAVELIKKGLAYVCELTPEEFRANRGSIGVPATSPWRDRPIQESLDLFARMRAGEFENGKYTLRAKIDLNSGNFNMRSPTPLRTPWRGSPTLCAPWSLKTTAPCTTGWCPTCPSPTTSPVRSSLPVWVSTTRS